MIHFPIGLKFVPFETRYPPEWVHDPSEEGGGKMCMEATPLHSTWAAMEALVDTGVAKNIGMCNVTTATLRDMLSYAKYPPAVLQVELHPHLQQTKLLRFCEQKEIAVVGFSPLGSGSYVELGMATAESSTMNEPVIKAIAEAHSVTPAQVVLRWGVQRGTCVIPKTSSQTRMVENKDLFGFELTQEEMTAVAGLDKHRRFNDPGVFCEFMGAFCPSECPAAWLPLLYESTPLTLLFCHVELLLSLLLSFRLNLRARPCSLKG